MALRKNNPVEPTTNPATDSTPAVDPETGLPFAKDTPTRTSRLRKPSPSAGAAPTGEPAAAQEPELLEPESQAQAAAAPSEKEKEKAVAQRPAARPPATGGGLGLVSPLDVLENQIAPGQLPFGTIPRYTATNGMIIDRDKNQLGAWLQFEPVSFNNLYMMAPGSSDEDAKEYIAFSHEGKEALQEALQAAIAAGYKKAEVKTYVELFGILLSAEKLPDDSPHLNKLVMLSLAPQSVGSWIGFKTQAAVQIKLGRMQVEDLKCITAGTKVVTGDFTYTIFTFE